jgi:hypothetical protein
MPKGIIDTFSTLTKVKRRPCQLFHVVSFGGRLPSNHFFDMLVASQLFITTDKGNM